MGVDWALCLPALDLDRLGSLWSLGSVTECEPRSQRTWRLQTAEGHGYYLKEHLDRQVLLARPVLCCVARQGVSVEIPRLSAHGCVLVEQDGRSYALYRELPGRQLDQCGAAPQPPVAHAIGTAIARLHLALANCPAALAAKLPQADLAADVMHWSGVLQGSHASLDAPWVRSLVTELCAVLGDPRQQLPRQLVHNDCHGGNVVFDAHGVPGFIDFDFMRTNLRLFDPCYCAAGLLVDQMEHTPDPCGWAELRGELFAGYDSLCHLQAAERAMAPYVIQAALVINAGWWVAEHRADLAGANLRALRWLTDVRS